MNILAVRVIEGPNMYSYRPIIRVKLDIGEYEDLPTMAIEDFNEQLIAMLPGLAEHHCSRGVAGGFLQRLQEGTYLAHVYEHILLELQGLAGYEVSFGKARWSGVHGVYDVVTSCRNRAVAMEAAYQTETVIRAALQGRQADMAAVVNGIKKAGQAYELGPSTAAICQAAQQKGIPISRIAGQNLLALGYGCKQRRIWATTTDRTGALATDLACDKHLTKQVLADGCIPVPDGVVVKSVADAVNAWREIGRPVAIKPLTGNQGKGVTLDVNSLAQVERAFHMACEYDREVLVEQFILGRQYRVCVVKGMMVAAAERIPAYVIGDGQSTVAQLVEVVNRNPNRGDGHEKPLTRILIDAVAITVLAKQGLTVASVPAGGQIVYIRENANLSTGGTAVDVTDMVHPINRQIVERAARLIGLDVAGVDIVAHDISQPIAEGTGAVIEINAAPGIRMHHYPSAGEPRNVAGAIVESLFPHNDTGRIPVIAITGTNGKTTVTRMISHIWQISGYKTGMTSTAGIYIDGCLICPGDTTGPASAKTVLHDPSVEVAVLETARGGMVRGGLSFDRSDVGIITNITEDHLGQDGIENLDDLAKVKSLVVETVRPDGFAVLNADDRYAPALAARAGGEIVYFSVEPDNIIIRRHLGIGGKAVFVRDGVIYAAQGKEAQFIADVRDVPITLGGLAQHNMQNAVIAAPACWCMKLALSYIQKGLYSFAENPGRLMLLPVDDFRVCIDYGHNPAGYQALINTARRLGASRLVGVIAAPGDRRDDVVINVGRIAGRGFDYIFIKEDQDLRGRKSGETAALLGQGLEESGFDMEQMEMIFSEKSAVKAALANACAGDIIVVFYEKYEDVLAVIKDFRCREKLLPVAPGVQPSQALAAGISAV